MLKTVRDIYFAMLVEQVKEEAPALQLAEFNFYLNDTIDAAIDDNDLAFEMNQKSTDYFRNLKSYASYTGAGITSGFKPYSYKVLLPEDYRFFKGISITYKMLMDYPPLCLKKDELFHPYEIKKYDVDKEQSNQGSMGTDYGRPSFVAPKYYFSGNELFVMVGENLYKTFPNIFFKIEKIDIEYLIDPPTYTLTYEQLNAPTDSSQTLLFQKDFIRIIKNRMAMRIFERIETPRTGSLAQVNQPQIHPTLTQIPRQ